MSSLNNVDSNDAIELDKTVIAVSLTKSLKLCVFLNEKKLEEAISAEGPFKIKGSGICCSFNLPFPREWVDLPHAVGRAVTQSFSEVVQKMRSESLEEMHTRTGRGEPLFRKETKTLRALELEVEIATEADAVAAGAGEVVLTVALLPDGTVRRKIREDEVRSIVRDRLCLLDCYIGCMCGCPQGECDDCANSVVPMSCSRLVALCLNRKAQQLWEEWRRAAAGLQPPGSFSQPGS